MKKQNPCRFAEKNNGCKLRADADGCALYKWGQDYDDYDTCPYRNNNLLRGVISPESRSKDFKQREDVS